MSDSSTSSKTYLALYDPSTNPSTLLKEWNSEQGSLSIGRSPKGRDSEAKDRSTGLFRSEKTKVMSTKHAEIEWIDDEPKIRDTHSTNGTYIVEGREGNVQLVPQVTYAVLDGMTIMFGRKVTSSRPGLSGDPLVLLARVSKSSSLDEISDRPEDKEEELSRRIGSEMQQCLQRSSTLSDRRSVELDSDEDLDVLGSSENEMLPTSTLAASRLPTCASSSSGRRGFGLSEEDLLATSSQDEEVSDVESVNKTKSYFDYISTRQISNKRLSKPASSLGEQDVDLSLRNDSDARSPFSSRLPSPISPDQLPSNSTRALDPSEPPCVPSEDELEEDHDYLHPPSGSQSGIFFSQSIISASSRLATFPNRQSSLALFNARLPSKTDDECEDAFSQASHLPSPQLSTCSSLEVDMEVDADDYRPTTQIEESTVVKAEDIGQEEEVISVEEAPESKQAELFAREDESDGMMQQISEDRVALDEHLESTRKIDSQTEEPGIDDTLEMEEMFEPGGEEEAAESEVEIESQVELDSEVEQPSESDVRSESYVIEDEEEGFWVDGGISTNEFREQEEIDVDGIDWQDPKPNGPTHAELEITVEKGLHEAEIDRDYEDAPLEYDGQPFNVDLDLDATAHEVDCYADGDPDVDEIDSEEEAMKRLDAEEEEEKEGEDKASVSESEVEEEIEISVEEDKDNIGVRAISPELKDPQHSASTPAELAMSIEENGNDTPALEGVTTSTELDASTTSLKRRLSDTDFEEDTSEDELEHLNLANISIEPKRRRIASHVFTFAVGVLSGAVGVVAGLSRLNTSLD